MSGKRIQFSNSFSADEVRLLKSIVDELLWDERRRGLHEKQAFKSIAGKVRRMSDRANGAPPNRKFCGRAISNDD